MRLPRWLVITIMTCWCWFPSPMSVASSIPAEIKEQVKSTLLPLFGMTKRPPKMNNVYIPETLKKLYEMQVKRRLHTASVPIPGLHTGLSNTVRSFIHIDSSIDNRFKTNSKFRLKFDVNTVPTNEQLLSAELKLIIEALTDELHKEYLHRIVINDIIKPGVKGKSEPILRVIDTNTVHTISNQTASFNVLPAVRRWFHHPKSNYGLLVTVHNVHENGSQVLLPTNPNYHHHIRLKRSASEAGEQWSPKQPLLLLYTDDGRNSRTNEAKNQKVGRRRRGTRSHHHHHHHHHRIKPSLRDPCKRRSMYVNFQDVGWSDWIVAPLGFDAFYCGGECEYPMAEHMNTTNHAIVQSLMNSAKPSHVPKPCCVPTQLSSMSMLYVDSQRNVILKNYKDMVAIGCGCR